MIADAHEAERNAAAAVCNQLFKVSFGYPRDSMDYAGIRQILAEYRETIKEERHKNTQTNLNRN